MVEDYTFVALAFRNGMGKRRVAYMHDLIAQLMPLYYIVLNFGEDRSINFGGEQANRWKLHCNSTSI